MPHYVPMFVAAGLLVAAGPEEKADLDRLQGTWKLVRYHWGDRDNPNVDLQWVIEGDSLTITETFTGRGSYTLDPMVRPGQFERTVNGVFPSKSTGIYFLDGDTFKTYSAILPVFKPPTEIPDEPAAWHLLQVWRRVDGDGGDGLDGTWKLVEDGFNKLRRREAEIQDHTMTVKAGRYTTRAHRVQHATIKLDPEASAKGIDITYKDSGLKGKTIPGAYRLAGDRLTVANGPRRPTEVPEGIDARGYYRVFERVKPRMTPAEARPRQSPAKPGDRTPRAPG